MLGPGNRATARHPPDARCRRHLVNRSSKTTLPAIAPPPNRASPDWAKGAVWYQVFPERFANANPANDPKPRISPGEGVYAKAWNSDWNAVELGELEAARAEAAARTPYAPALAPSGQRAVTTAWSFGVAMAAICKASLIDWTT